MEEQASRFSELIDKKTHQVFLFGCPANIPFNFSSHTWFVLNKCGTISRWELLFTRRRGETSWGHLHLNFFRPFQGIDMLPVAIGLFWKPKLLGATDGDTAKRMIEFIENSPSEYPYCHRYSLAGPNSNTYTQWVLEHFPECRLTLPRNAIGKNYKTQKE